MDYIIKVESGLTILEALCKTIGWIPLVGQIGSRFISGEGLSRPIQNVFEHSGRAVDTG